MFLCSNFIYLFFRFVLAKRSNLKHKPQKSVDGIGTLDRLNIGVKTIHNALILVDLIIKLKY